MPRTKKKKGKNDPKHRNWRVARSLVLLLGPGPDGDEDRWDQGQDLLRAWNDAQFSVHGMLWELINLKYSDKVRCEPCGEAVQGNGDQTVICSSCGRDRAEYATITDVITNGP